MINGIRKAIRGAYGVPILGYLLVLLVGIVTLPRTVERVRALSRGAKNQRRVMRRAIKANDTALALKRHLPAFMTAISSVKALASHVAKTETALLALEAKVEAALQHANETKNASAGAPVTEILSPEKLGVHPLKLHFGRGRAPLQGFVTIDERRLPGVDIVAPVDQLPLEAGSVDEIRCTHIIERFEPRQLETVVLPSWVRLLKAGGRFSAVVLDAEATIRSYAEGGCTFDEFREAFFGAPEDQVKGQLYRLTPESLAEMMRAAGLVQTTIVAAGRRNDRGFEFEISGVRAQRGAGSGRE